MIAADFCGSAGHVIRLAADLNAEEVTPDVGAISSTLSSATGSL